MHAKVLIQSDPISLGNFSTVWLPLLASLLRSFGQVMRTFFKEGPSLQSLSRKSLNLCCFSCQHDWQWLFWWLRDCYSEPILMFFEWTPYRSEFGWKDDWWMWCIQVIELPICFENCLLTILCWHLGSSQSHSPIKEEAIVYWWCLHLSKVLIHTNSFVN